MIKIIILYLYRQIQFNQINIFWGGIFAAINDVTYQDGLHKILTACDTFTKPVCKYL